MVCIDRTTTSSTITMSTGSPFSSPPPSTSSSPTQSSGGGPPSPPPPVVILSPCAACKILRRRCAADKCVLAPYFPPTDPLRFTTAHRVFGASNIMKLLQELPESQRADAVSSMVYEANARIRDPVYGCAGVICQLQKQVSDLQAELAKTQAELVNMQCQQANLVTLICMEMSESQEPIFLEQQHHQEEEALYDNASFSVDDGFLAPAWETLWA